ncbi:MAG: prephenate/arogenate dehydrogenase [Gemmatimonadaceae bacterium]|nr:prephenate/arogenate dehydrogenase [Gloeobacterales cyanobacterium ES-bin-141]
MRIGIVGLGLIGGSLGLDLRQRGHHVVGVSRQAQTIALAEELGVADQAWPDCGRLQDREVVFVCTPTEHVLPTIQILSTVLEFGTVITDVASVKGSIVPSAESLWSAFVGGHPMAGTEQQGIRAARPLLFERRPYVLTPTRRTATEALERVEFLVKDLGANLYRMDPDLHDLSVARISHLPVFVSAALLLNLASADDRQAEQLASSGFYDTTRVGGGNPQLGESMARWNRAALLNELKHYRKTLDRFEKAIERSDWATVTELLAASRDLRTRVFPAQDEYC